MPRFLPRTALVPSVLAALAAIAPAQGVSQEFLERFALADDRRAALELLIPGSEDAFFYRCLALQHEGDLDGVAELLPQWIERHGRSARVEEIENRQALLGYERDPAATFAFLRGRLGLSFDEEREAATVRADLPSRLDPALLAREVLARRALELHPGSLSGFEGVALPWVAAGELAPELLHELLARLDRPDVPGLAALVVRDLARERGPAFGRLDIHGLLLAEQFAECARLRPKLLEETAFVEGWIARLRPGADADVERDAAAREAWLQRLEDFVLPLAPVHDSLKAHVLHHRLAHDLARGRVDERRLRAYLRLPRRSAWASPESLRGQAGTVDPARQFPTGLEPVGDDEALVRACLAELLRGAADASAWSDLVRDDWLRRLFVETKLLAGEGDPARWAALVDDPAWLAALEARVEIEFAPTQPRHFGARDGIAIEVDLKNAGDLLVKVFEIDTFNWYRSREAEVDATIPLDGLIANHELLLELDAPPLRRVRRRIELPQIERPGVYVVELIGNGRASRAVIHKGRLDLVERTGSAGHVLRVVDEDGTPLPDARLWFAGREIAPDADGLLRLPFSTDPGSRPILLRHGERTSLAHLQHLAESYSLSAAVLAERETLLSRARARLLVRPTLALQGRPVDLALLEDPVLSIASRDGAGVAATLDVRDLALDASGELVHEIQVPEGLTRLEVRLRGHVRSLSEDRDVELESPPVALELNGIDATEATSCALLGRSASGWHLDLLGRNGEPKARRAVTLALQHREFTDATELTLATDEHGRVELGTLEGVRRLGAWGPGLDRRGWDLTTEARTLPQRLHGVAGEVLRLPWQGAATKPERAAFALFELRGGVFARDAFAQLALSNGFLELRDLAAGDYLLRLEELGRHVEVRVAAGEERDGWVQSRARRLELGPRESLAVRSLAATDDEVVLQLAHAGAQARVHAVATRYRPARDPFLALRAPEWRSPDALDLAREPSSYHAGREVGDEYRYVLERRAARKFPGNLLPRPGLLLNPWSVGQTDVEADATGRSGGSFGGRRVLKARGGGATERGFLSDGAADPGAFPDLDFLPRPARVLANLRPDAEGRVRIPRAELGDGQELHVVALDARDTVYVSLALEERPLVPADLRLARPLDTARHHAEQRRVEFVDAGGVSRIEDAGSSRAETYDSLGSVFRLFRTLAPSAGLDEFAFLLRWPELPDEEKRALYSEHVCHELHLFLLRKDPRFFAQVVEPYLANKATKTFFDRWLLGEDLRAYLDPWAYGRLNVVERILLSERIEGEREPGARALRERLEARPIDAAVERELFEAALAGTALLADADLGAVLRDAEQAPYRGPGDTAPPGSGPATPGPGGPGAPAGGAPAAARASEEGKASDDAISTGSDEFFLGRGESERLQAGLEQDKAARESVRGLWRAPERTQAWEESDWWRVRAQDAGPDLIELDPFWLDFALRDAGASFRSPHFMHAADNLSEMLLALAVLDLPFEAGEHALEVEGRAVTLRAASPLLVVRKDVLEARPPATDEAPLLMSQDLYRLDEPTRLEGSERRDAFVTGDLQVDVAYGCRVVLTNPTSAARRLQVLLQIPAGALPLRSGFRTKSFDVELEPYDTEKLEYAFYFPAAGTFEHYPAHAARDGALVASVPAVRRTVVSVAPALDTRSWEHVSQSASDAEVLVWLAAANLERVDLARIAWRLRGRGFFDALIAELRARHAYDARTWSYGLWHEDPAAAREFLRHQDGFLDRCGRALVSPLVTIDPLERGTWRRVEFEPLFHGRAHRFGGRRESSDRSLEAQYRSLLDLLAYRAGPSDLERLDLTVLLLAQDRVEDALAQFARVDPARVSTTLQLDYVSAYLGFFRDGAARSREIAQAHRDHPVERWRARFRAVLEQLDEAEGRAPAPQPGDVGQSALATVEPALELAVEAGRATLAWRNLERCELRYYPLDVEFQFSTDPFARQDAGASSFVRPARSDAMELPGPEGRLDVELPAGLAGANVLVEARAGGLVRRATLFASALAVRTIDAYGQLVVSAADGGRPLPQVYVKVFARTAAGRVRFHKDGYTDLRGRFDYASRTGAALEPAERYAILVLSETDGAVLREVAPPPQ